MRRLLPIFGTLALWSSAGYAQQCAVPQPYCAPSTCAPNTSPKVGGPAPTTNERFVRGPAPGAAAGESNSLGIRGPTLHIPEIRISLPHLELPSLFQVRHDAVKIFGPTLSPLIDEPALELNNVGEAPPDVGSSPKVGSPECSKPCMPYCPPACAAPNQCADLDAQLRELNQKLARLEALEAQITQLKEEQRTATRATTAAPVGNASKPPVSPESVVKSSRPVPRPQAPKYQTASYEEPVETVAAPKRVVSEPVKTVATPVQVRSRSGLSSPVANVSTDNYGDWTTKK